MQKRVLIHGCSDVWSYFVLTVLWFCPKHINLLLYCLMPGAMSDPFLSAFDFLTIKLGGENSFRFTDFNIYSSCVHVGGNGCRSNSLVFVSIALMFFLPLQKGNRL